MGKFELKTEKTKEEKKPDTHEQIKKFLDTKQWKEENPLERAKKFEVVKTNPPEPGYMEIEVIQEEKDNGEPIVVTKSKGPKGDEEEKVIKYDPIMTIDLKTLIEADVGRCPSNVIPFLIDQAVQLEAEEKKVFKHEKRKEPFNWWWIIFFLLMIPGIVLIILIFIGG